MILNGIVSSDAIFNDACRTSLQLSGGSDEGWHGDVPWPESSWNENLIYGVCNISRISITLKSSGRMHSTADTLLWKFMVALSGSWLLAAGLSAKNGVSCVLLATV